MTTKSMPSTSGNPIQDNNNNNNNNNNHDDGDRFEKVPVRRKKTTTTSSSIIPTTPVPPSVVCQICQEQSSRYTCPRCSIHTCSLSCCQKHKRDTSCNGRRRRRDTTMYVPLSQMNDCLLQSDFHFLQTATTTMDATRRLWNQMISTTSSNNNNNNSNNSTNNDDEGPTTSAGSRRHHRPNPSQQNLKRPRYHDDTVTTETRQLCGVPTLHAPLLDAVVSTTTNSLTTIGSTAVTESSPASPLPSSNDSRRRFSHGHIPLTLQTLSKFHHSSNYHIHLLVLPDFMERHLRNQSHFVVSSLEDGLVVLHWTMEICFVHDDTDGGHHSTKTTTTKLHCPNPNDTIVVHSIPETISLPELLDQAITKWQSTKRQHTTLSLQTNNNHHTNTKNNNSNNTASSIISTDDDDDTDRHHTTYQWYLKQIPCPANNPTYIHVATTTTTTNHTTTLLLKDILRHQTVLEFPTLYLTRTTTATLESDPNNNTA